MPYKNREQQLAAQKSHWEQNKEKFRDRTKQRRIERAQWWSEYKDDQKFACKICGESHPACIAFHHREPSMKLKSVADLVTLAYPVEVILEEIEKCEVLCHNCHAKHHWDVDVRRRNYAKVEKTGSGLIGKPPALEAGHRAGSTPVSPTASVVEQ